MCAKSVTFAGKTYNLDNWGFLKDPDEWDENFADGFAQCIGIYKGLTDRHWSLIHYLRDKFLTEKTVPVMVYACIDNKITLKTFRSLFPTGYHRGACLLAGINYEFMYETNYWLTYETAPLLKHEFPMTQLGYLKDFEKWNERFAFLILKEWNEPPNLNKEQRKIICYLRDFYMKKHTIPSMCEMCNSNHLSFEKFNALFPRGYRRGACRLAGLPFFA